MWVHVPDMMSLSTWRCRCYGKNDCTLLSKSHLCADQVSLQMDTQPTQVREYGKHRYDESHMVENMMRVKALHMLVLFMANSRPCVAGPNSSKLCTITTVIIKSQELSR